MNLLVRNTLLNNLTNKQIQMRNFIYFALVALLLSACNGKDYYSVSGTIQGIEDGNMVTLNFIDGGQLILIDSVAVKNGKFKFKGKTDTCSVSILTFNIDDQMHNCTFFTEAGEITVDYANGVQRLGGTKTNISYQDFYDQTDKLNQEAMVLESKIRNADPTGADMALLQVELRNLQDSYLILISQSIEKNCDNTFGFEQLMDSYDVFEPEQVSKFLEMMEPKFSNNSTYIDLKTIIDAQLRTTAGNQFINFTTPILLNGKNTDSSVNLSDYVGKNKIILLDFWASWCGPCRQEIPMMKEIYAKYKSLGFEIVSVSVDEDQDAWKQAILEDGMNWPQLINLMDERDSPAELYAIQVIPSTFLIDSDGTILARNLRGEEIGSALEDFFSTK